MSTYYILMPIFFLLGILMIAFEDISKINKGAIALFTCIALWSMLLFSHTGGSLSEGFSHFIESNSHLRDADITEQAQEYISYSILMHLGDVSGTIFFILCTVLLIDTVDKYGGFKTITYYLNHSNKRVLLWRISFAAFFFSALLDNLAAAILIVAMLRRLVPDRTDRLKYACMAIISCNAGGSFSPIGDVTTLLIWTSGRLSPLYQISKVFLPALMNMLIPLIIATFWLFKKGAKLRIDAEKKNTEELSNLIPERRQKTVFWIGVSSLIMIPILQTTLNMPAFMGALVGLTIIWIYSELMFRHLKQNSSLQDLRLSSLMHGVDLSSIFYFLGVLMSVAALETAGHLGNTASYLNQIIPDAKIIAFITGILSSMLDNVALVAGVIGMYNVDPNTASMFAMNGDFWTFLAYCAVTGGSLLIIGSATGITIMGLENISFSYYFKRFSILALAGYIGGALLQLLLFV